MIDELRLEQIVAEACQRRPEARETIERVANSIRGLDSPFAAKAFEGALRKFMESGDIGPLNTVEQGLAMAPEIMEKLPAWRLKFILFVAVGLILAMTLYVLIRVAVPQIR